ncbi:MAG: alginate export family protein [Bacteroidales bacterium]|nr:alginate export family protein [Bacteroidales bacterium]
MNKLLRTAFLVCLFSLSFFSLRAQEAADNTFTLNMNMLTRGEVRYGEFREEDETIEGLSHFVLSRYRLTTNYKRSWLEAKISLQQAGTWGSAGGSFGLSEAWVGVKSQNGWFAKFGRQTLAYDDERIIGTNDWSVTAPSHDVLRMGFENKYHKVHALLAYNQNPDNMNGQTYYTGGLQPYKSMQTLWYHFDVPKTKLGASLLFMNIGMQKNDPSDLEVLYQQLIGTYVAFKPQYWSAEASYYYQMGLEEHGIQLDAFMASVKATVKPRDSYSIFAGYDYLSGDRYFAVPPEGGVGMVFHDKARGFNPLYGSHHQFYGMMDFFYLSTYLNSFTPGLQNAFLGVTYKPMEKLDLNASVHYLAMATTLPGVNKTLGQELEFSANYSFTKYFAMEAGYSYMHGTETLQFLKRVSDGQRLHWGYLMLVVNPDVFTASWNDKK